MINILYLHAGAEMYGADRVLLELIKGLDKTKFRPIVVLPCDGVLVEELRKNGIWTEVLEYPILRRKYFNLRGIIRYSVAYPVYSDKIIKLVKNMDISLIHVNTTAVLEGIYLKKCLKVPVIWHIHEILTHPKIMYQFISYLIGKFADVPVVVSRAVGNHLTASGKVRKSKIKVIYNGVDNEEFHSGYEVSGLRKEWDIPEKAIVIGMIGRVNAWKGQNDFLLAMEPVLERHKNVYAVLVGGVFQGEEWRMEELKDKVSKSCYKNRIVISDFRTDTPNIHNLFDVFVLPSTNPDPLPTVVLEAMATGRPVVGYRHGGICEMVEDGKTGLLAEHNNPKALGEKIEYLVQHPDVMEEMKKQSLIRQKEHFSLEKYIYKFERLYSSFSD